MLILVSRNSRLMTVAWFMSVVLVVHSFGVGKPVMYRSSKSVIHAKQSDDLRSEAADLLDRAKALRDTLPEDKKQTQSENSPERQTADSPWTVPSSDSIGVGYRLYLDIGREEGTWMDPRWGASGNRIEFSADVKFLTETFANQTVMDRMVSDNFGGSSSPVYEIESSPFARLRSGFDRMACHGGGYRIDSGGRGGGTARFHLLVNGTPERDSTYGDIFIPKGCLYFSLPCFGNSISQLSTKEGPVTVRQIGWHTGWRREESRIVGTFRAVPIEKAQARDGF